MKILMVLTSHNTLGNTGKPTGFWLDEFATPYYAFIDAGAKVTVASVKGGQPPIDPKSEEASHQTDAMERFKSDSGAQKALSNSMKLSEVAASGYDAVFYPGGHGPLWDLVDNKKSIALIEEFYSAHKPIAFVCHAPAVLKNVTYKGQPIVKGKRITGFSNSEEEATKLTKVVPFLLEDELKREGGLYEKGSDGSAHTVVDGQLITGQNPASSGPAAMELIKLLKAERPREAKKAS